MGWLQQFFGNVGDWFQNFGQNIGQFFVRWHEYGFSDAFAQSPIMRYYANWIDKGGPPFVQKMERVFGNLDEVGSNNALEVIRAYTQFLGSAVASPIGVRTAKLALGTWGIPPQAIDAAIGLAADMWAMTDDRTYQDMVRSNPVVAEIYANRLAGSFLQSARVPLYEWPIEVLQDTWGNAPGPEHDWDHWVIQERNKAKGIPEYDLYASWVYPTIEHDQRVASQIVAPNIPTIEHDQRVASQIVAPNIPTIEHVGLGPMGGAPAPTEDSVLAAAAEEEQPVPMVAWFAAAVIGVLALKRLT